jgi:hypothetical protein
LLADRMEATPVYPCVHLRARPERYTTFELSA